MLRFIGFVLLCVAAAVSLSVIFTRLVTVPVGLWYNACDHEYEQHWLDQAIVHLKTIHYDDPKLQARLDYTIRRHHTVGGFSVMVLPCFKGVAGINSTVLAWNPT